MPELCTRIIWEGGEPYDCHRQAKTMTPVGPRCDRHPYARVARGMTGVVGVEPLHSEPEE